MIASLSPVTAGGGLPLPQQVALCARHGFAGLEVNINAVRDLGINDARVLFQHSDVIPVAFNLPVEWRTGEETFRESLAQLPMLSRLAADLGISRCTTYVSLRPMHPPTNMPKSRRAVWLKLPRFWASRVSRSVWNFSARSSFGPTPIKSGSMTSRAPCKPPTKSTARQLQQRRFAG